MAPVFMHPHTFVVHNTGITERDFECELLTLKPDGTLTVKGGYAWDGCSPKIVICGLAFGTPDGIVDLNTGRPKTYFASLVHDALYQCKATEIGVSRLEADALFLNMARHSGFRYAGLYYRLIRLFGGLYGSWSLEESDPAAIKRIKRSSLEYEVRPKTYRFAA